MQVSQDHKMQMSTDSTHMYRSEDRGQVAIENTKSEIMSNRNFG